MYTTSIPVIHFFSGSVIMSQEHLKRLMCQGHYKKLSMVDSRKFEGFVHFRKAIVAFSFKGTHFSTFDRISYSNFCLKSIMLNARKHLQ